MGGDAAQPLQLPIYPTGDAFSHRRTAGRPQRFPTGAAVEVQTDEEDFKGVYFSATVIEPPNSPRKSGKKKSKKLYVEYHNLLAHEDGSDRLREYVDATFVRPVPPLLDTGKGFEPDDVVDAFYKDGWWTGVVTRPVEGGERFVVTFHNPPDELEFGLAELRAHWDWVNGSWVRPQKQSITGLMFDVGRKVEVSIDREDFQDAWFPATIHEDMGNGTFLVEYSSKNTDNDGLFTKVRVDSLHIRPCPPLLKDKNFVLLEKVDAFFDLGWWSGIITKQLENSRYLVFFKQMKRDKEFNQSELRPQMEWKDGKWFTSSQPQESSIPSLDDGACQHHTPENSSASVATAPVKNSMDEKDTCAGKPHPSLISKKGHSEPSIPDNLKLAHVSVPLAKRRAYLSDSAGALSQPHKKLKEGNLVGANKKARHDGSEKEVICGFLSPVSVSNMENSVAQTTLDQSSSNRPWEENVQRKQRNSRTPLNVGGKNSSTNRSLGKSIAQILESLDIDDGEKEPDTTGNTEVVDQNGHEKQEPGLPVVIGLPCAETGSSGFGISRGKRSQLSNKTTFSVDDQKQEVNDSTSQKIEDGKQSRVGDVSERKKRGRPKKNLVESTETLVTGNAENRDISSGDSNRKADDSQRICEVAVIGMEASISNPENATANPENTTTIKEDTTANQEKIANGQFAPGKRKARMTKQMLSSKHKKDNVEESVRPGVGHSSKRGRRQISSGKISVKVRDLVDASGGKPEVVNHGVEVEKVIELPSNEFDNEPLSKWIEEMNMSSAIDGSKLPVDSAVQCTVNDDNQGHGVVLGVTSEKQPDRGDKAPTEPQSLPFVNSSVAVVLDEANKKQSKRGTRTAKLVDKVSTVTSEPRKLPSVEEMSKLPVDSAVQYTVNDDNQGHGVVLGVTSEKQPDRGDKAPTEPQSLPFVNSSVAVVLDEANKKQSKRGTRTAKLVDKVSTVTSEPRKLPSVEEMSKLPVDSAVQCTVNDDNQGNGVVLGVTSEKQPDRGDIAPTEPQSLPSVVLDEANKKQSKRGTRTAKLVDKVSTVTSEPRKLPSVEEMTMVVLLNQDGEKQSENEARATAMVDRSSLIPSHPQSSVEKTVDIVLDQDNEKRPENGSNLALASVDNADIVLSEPENLPFVKNTILWKTIESMEVFQKMPQKPHFQPLENFKESSREGVAIGYMVTFSSLVERTSKLQINDPISTMFDIKESLAELEKHGFNVTAVEDCVNKLLAVKNVEEKLVHDVSTLDDQITEHNHEITRIESDIEEINEHIAVLQKKLSLAKSAKAKEDEEIAFLLVRRRETQDTIENVKNDFNGIVSSIL